MLCHLQFNQLDEFFLSLSLFVSSLVFLSPEQRINCLVRSISPIISIHLITSFTSLSMFSIKQESDALDLTNQARHSWSSPPLEHEESFSTEDETHETSDGLPKVNFCLSEDESWTLLVFCRKQRTTVVSWTRAMRIMPRCWLNKVGWTSNLHHGSNSLTCPILSVDIFPLKPKKFPPVGGLIDSDDCIHQRWTICFRSEEKRDTSELKQAPRCYLSVRSFRRTSSLS